MRKLSLLLLCLAVSFILLSALIVARSSFGHSKRSFTDTMSGKDIRQEIVALNSNEKMKPTKAFRSGHVSSASLTNYFHKTENGYYIQLPAETMVPTPAIIDGNIFLSGGFGSKQYYSFESTSGKIKWAIDLDDDGPSSPAIEDGIIVFNTESCTIFACDLVTGKMIWSYYLGDPLMSMPSIANGIVFTSYPAHYAADFQGTRNDSLKVWPTHVLIAIDLKTGNILWQKWIDSDIMSAPVAKNELLYVTTFSGAVYKINQKSGDILEARAMRATSIPVFSSDNEVIVSQRTDTKNDSVVSESIAYGIGSKSRTTFSKKAHYLDKKVQSKSNLKSYSMKMDAGNGFATGAPTTSNWMAAELNIGYSNVSSLQSFQGSRGLYIKNRLYNTMGDEIICTNDAGDVKWKYNLQGDLKNEGGFMGTPPIYCNGFIIVATFTGEVLILNEKDGRVFSKYEIKNPVRYQPVVDKGWIYVTTANGRLYAIDTGNPSITGWNMWGANAARNNVN
ncbi:MAG: PQQ-binding-like beta-propeller repeat protein [Chitinophagales bacterium]